MNLESYIDQLQQFNPNYDMTNIIKAFNFSEEAHRGQFRKSGERYFIHPVHVSLIIAELELDEVSIIAGLLHDVIEDTEYTYDDISKMFGKVIADIVDGVTKLGQISFDSKEEQQVENLRKMFLAMAKDIRVILIKLADRLHNMRTLKFMSEEKKKEKAEETLEIYAPIAHRLGISKVKWELEDLALLYIDPEKYYELIAKVNKKRTERESLIENVIKKIRFEVKDAEIPADINGRPKHFYSIYRKMMYQNKNFDEIFDLTAIRVVVDNVKDCYGVLGIVHTLWKPIPGRFKDYIAMPKPNMYQSLHTTVIGDNGEPFEIQIRTHEMHKIAEFGIAAHWMYKEKKETDDLGDKLTWIRQMMEWERDIENPSEFMESLRLDVFSNQVYVFTPNGEVVELPDGATPVDFAYKIHSAVGNKCVGSKVDGRIVPLNYKLQNGNIIEIMTSKNSTGPSRDWLNFVKSTQARSKIKQFFKKERRSENIENGKEILEREIKRQGMIPKKVLAPEYVQGLLRRLSCKDVDDLYAAIGYGGIATNQVVPKLKERYAELNKKEIEEQKEIIIAPKEEKHKINKQGVSVEGIDDVLIRFAKCCNPVPGDQIIGFITRGRGVTIHKSDCTNFEKTNDSKERYIEVEWIQDKTSTYSSEIQIISPDRRGLLSEITAIISEQNLIVKGLNARVNEDEIATINVTVEISDTKQLNKLMNKMKMLSEVFDVKRVRS
ncbi:MAG: bifunctional (p)ppGpp synthetase/guanosine-3',5'-bis(diphosphate) 3'-pyrophosphohydrolase [Clostridiales bacterium]|nr:bifunctional (p)ppGpp synthetase/guanosine-3',5'-bis(diphosphate) 3'-pyrophosphohydrolase [Clostridiales bacterium]